MTTWSPVEQEFHGATLHVRKMRGTRVRTRRQLVNVTQLDPDSGAQSATDVRRHTEGFIADQLGRDILVVFPAHGPRAPKSLAQLQHSDKGMAVLVNLPTFKHHFEIEQD